MNTEKGRIFISYSHRGNGLAWKELLLKQLAVFESHHLLDPWHDDETKLGDDWHERIKAAMGSARLAVLLLTDEFLKSPFVLQHELPELQRRHKDEHLIVAPILCEKCDWEANAWLASLQIKPRVQATPVPLVSFSETDRERILRQLATEIAGELGNAALSGHSLLGTPDSALGEAKTYLDKFPLTRGPGLREEKLIGREQELALLDLAFAQPHTAIVSLVAWGGVGKTMLVQHWLQRLQREGWFGARRVYAWSFYSQGTKEDRQASEDTFLAHALEWFGVQCEPTLSPWDKGRLLADAVARERTLLILDGIEPLQYPPGPMGGQLRAPGVQSLLKQLARRANSAQSQISNRESQIGNALCLVTTREPLTDLADFQRREGSPWGSVLRVDLGNLTEEAGAALLHHAGAKRAGATEIKPADKELLAASREVDGHALTLNLLGRFLARAHGGDIRRRDLVKFEEADRKEQGGTTFKMLAAFEQWFDRGGAIYQQSLAILRILGLFDRPADPGCTVALRRSPAIGGLTAPLFQPKHGLLRWKETDQPIPDEDWNTATSFLTDFGLVGISKYDLKPIKGFSQQRAEEQIASAQRDFSSPLGLGFLTRSLLNEPDVIVVPEMPNGEAATALDIHPLIREYFGKRLREFSPKAWRKGHQRLYERLTTSVPYWPQGLDGLQPLYHAIYHGCKAGLLSQACTAVFFARITRGEEYFSTKKLGAFGTDLNALASFFDEPWRRTSIKMEWNLRASLQTLAGHRLRALNRLSEAAESLQDGRQLLVQHEAWGAAASCLDTLVEVDLALGRVDDAVRDAHDSVSFADRHGEEFECSYARTSLGAALHQAGDLEQAFECFGRAEKIQCERQPEIPYLHSFQGFRYCDLLLVICEKDSWHHFLFRESGGLSVDQADEALTRNEQVAKRAKRTLHGGKLRGFLLDPALDSLSLGRIGLYWSVLMGLRSQPPEQALGSAQDRLNDAVNGLRRYGDVCFLPLALMPRAWVGQLKGNFEGARADLDEAWEIAERGPMRLHMADIHLYRARLFFREKEYPWREGMNLNGEFVTNRTAADDLAAAEKLINDCGYHRRDEELADAKRAILGVTMDATSWHRRLKPIPPMPRFVFDFENQLVPERLPNEALTCLSCLSEIVAHSDEIIQCSISRDGTMLTTASQDNSLKIWDLATGNLLTTLTGHSRGVESCCFSYDLLKVVSGSRDGSVRMWSVATGRELDMLQSHGDEVRVTQFSPDGNCIVSADIGGMIKLWDAKTKNLIRTWQVNGGGIRSATFSPDGRLFVTGSYDGILTVWDFQTYSINTKLTGHENVVTACCFSPDGSLLLSASDDHSLKIWDWRKSLVLTTLLGHTGPVCSCGFSPDGLRIVSGSVDTKLKCWDARTARELVSVVAHSDYVRWCSFTPDGERVISAASDGTLKVWDAKCERM
ncbi:MAG: TIR domain-containing protein [Verrucomicrobia bacterium]|nr:TIR domain-containing protein [Verrucomicrobiota bacterium]